jgi:hypothetical protein
MSELEKLARKVHQISTESHPDHQRIPWEDLNEVNIAACRAVARWLMMKLEGKAKR